MKRDIDFIRETLLELEENCEPMSFYPISSIMCEKGYAQDYALNQLLLMEEAGLVGKTITDYSGSCWGVIETQIWIKGSNVTLLST